MNLNCQKFLEAIGELTLSMQSVIDEEIKDWSPDEPPLTTIFGVVGDQIVLQFNGLDDSINLEIFRLIEDAMTSDDRLLITAVATGLIEAVGSTLENANDLDSRIIPMLGTLSRRHFDAWLAF